MTYNGAAVENCQDLREALENGTNMIKYVKNRLFCLCLHCLSFELSLHSPAS